MQRSLLTWHYNLNMLEATVGSNLQTPSHGMLPSGLALFSGLAANALTYIVHRVWSGPKDTMCGLSLSSGAAKPTNSSNGKSLYATMHPQVSYALMLPREQQGYHCTPGNVYKGSAEDMHDLLTAAILCFHL